MSNHFQEVIAALLVVLIIVVLFKPKEGLKDKQDKEVKEVLKKLSISHINGRWLGKQGEFLQLKVFVPSLSYKKDGLKTSVRHSKWSIFAKEYVSELVGTNIVIFKDSTGKAVFTVKALNKKNIEVKDSAGLVKVYTRQASHLDKLTPIEEVAVVPLVKSI